MTFRLCFPALLLLGAFGAAPARSGDAPPSTTRILEVDSLRGVSGFFNLAQGTVRAFALVSPTAPECGATIDSVVALLERYPSRRLRGYVVFVPTVEGDTRVAALLRSSELTDGRLVLFYNENGSLLNTFAPAAAGAANVLLLFDTDATFGAVPGEPAASILPSPPGEKDRLARGLLSRRAGELLAAFEEKRREAQKTTR